MSPHLLESAAARPQNLYEYEQVSDIVTLGVRLIEAVGKNHCFEQGNKRTAFHAGLVFMQRNGMYFDLVDSQKLAELVTAVITGADQSSALIDLLRRHRW